jgi:hypothetical protein
MDPNTGRMYDTVEDAKAAGVEDPVEVSGSLRALQTLSANLQSRLAKPQPVEEEPKPKRRGLTAAERSTRAKRQRMARASRKTNRKSRG